jgi:hypothetical protein
MQAPQQAETTETAMQQQGMPAVPARASLFTFGQVSHEEDHLRWLLASVELRMAKGFSTVSVSDTGQ